MWLRPTQDDGGAYKRWPYGNSASHALRRKLEGESDKPKYS